MAEMRTMTWETVRERDYFGTVIAILRINGFALGKVEEQGLVVEGSLGEVQYKGYSASYQDDRDRPNGTCFIRACATESEARLAVEVRMLELLPSWLECPTCGTPHDPSQHEPVTRARLRKTGWCHTCDFWERHIVEATGVVINHRHYSIGDEGEVAGRRRSLGGWGLGCGGAEYEIEFLADARRVVTHNLWVQGKIPERFRDRLPDNARFVTAEERQRESVSYPFLGAPEEG